MRSRSVRIAILAAVSMMLTLTPGDLVGNTRGVDILIFVDGFESGGLTLWTTSTGLRPIGESCQSNASCHSGLCFSELDVGWPGGLCTQICNYGECPSGFECAPFGAESYCFDICVSEADCRSGHSCLFLNPNFPTFCLPNCTTDGDCPAVGSCNIWSGLCGPIGGLNLTGGPCTSDADCESDLCLEEGSVGPYSFPGGYCVSVCSLAEGTCPGDGVCLNFDTGWSFNGLCFDGCTLRAECRPGYYCQDFGSGVCLY